MSAMKNSIALAAAALLLAAPLAASAQSSAPQAPTPDQIAAITALNGQFFDDVHYSKIDEFTAITAPNFSVTYPDGSTITGDQLFARAASRNLEESGYQHDTVVNSMTTDGATITENVSTKDIASLSVQGDQDATQTDASNRTLTWTQDSDGNWQVASELISKSSEFPYGAQRI